MLFSSILFIFLFLPIFLMGYYLIDKAYRNALLLLASLIFYAWGEASFVLILMVSLIVNYYIALLIGSLIHKHKEATTTFLSKSILAIAIICNLLPLLYFKYSNFIVYNLASIFSIHLDIIQHWKQVVLPIGISFYTFQAMSYVIDVYRKDIPHSTSFINFACYVTCFP